MTSDQQETMGSEVQEGRFVRQANAFTDRITADGSSGWPAEADRYVLYWSRACPWAHRQVIVRELLRLTEAIGLVTVNPWRDGRGWNLLDGYDDPANGFSYLQQAYDVSLPQPYEWRVTVPTIWDTREGRVVTNDYRVIDVQLNDEFRAVATRPDVDLHPEDLRDEIAEVEEQIFHDVNNGVYTCGFASSQAAYDEAWQTLFARLDDLEERLSTRRFLLGDRLTLADVRLFTTLVRFDAVYVGHFRCDRNTLRGMPNLHAYLRDLFQTRGFGETIDMAEIKRHHYTTHDDLNPSRLIPRGPGDVADLNRPHDRDRLGPPAAV